jgi:hypothetical protein
LYRAKQTGRNAVYYAEVPRGDAVPARWAATRRTTPVALPGLVREPHWTTSTQ